MTLNGYVDYPNMQNRRPRPTRRKIRAGQRRPAATSGFQSSSTFKANSSPSGIDQKIGWPKYIAKVKAAREAKNWKS